MPKQPNLIIKKLIYIYIYIYKIILHCCSINLWKLNKNEQLSKQKKKLSNKEKPFPIPKFTTIK